MIITAKEAADLCVALYSGDRDRFFHLDDGADDGVWYGVSQVRDAVVVTLRGSVTLGDWLRDFFALCARDPWSSQRLGPVHMGFYLGMTNVCREVIDLAKGAPLVVVGHSLGAARATLLAGMLVIESRAPVGRIVFGEPLSGCAPLSDLLRDIPSLSFRNGDDRHHDSVCDVPFRIPPIAMYERASALTHVCSPPAADDPWGPLSWHHMGLYQQAVSAI